MTACVTACAKPGRDVIEMYEHTRAAGFGAEVRRRIMIGTYVLSAGYYDAYYLRAQKVRTLIKRDFEDCFARGVHAMLTPATPSAAFGIGEKGGADPVEMYLNDIFTVTVNMAGLPGIAVPAGLDGQGLPLGLQLIGRAFDEETLFSLGHVIEQAAGHFMPARHGGNALRWRLFLRGTGRDRRKIFIAVDHLLPAVTCRPSTMKANAATATRAPSIKAPIPPFCFSHDRILPRITGEATHRARLCSESCQDAVTLP